jgi:hypothetical protein
VEKENELEERDKKILEMEEKFDLEKREYRKKMEELDLEL